MIQIFNQYEMVYAEMPFEADKSQVIYFDSGTSHELNLFVRLNLRELKAMFSRWKLEFCYMPAMFRDEEALRKQILYRIPWLQDVDYEQIERLKAVQASMIEELTLSKTSDAEVVFREDQDKVLIKIDISNPRLYREQFEHIARTYGQKVSRDLYAHAAEDPDIINLFRTLLEKKPKGVVRELIERELAKDEVLSRVVIKKDCNIVLPEYNRTIKLHPIEKTLFFLYLLHPEGIAFKDLIDYKAEIYHIYGHLSNQSDPAKVAAAVERLFELDSNAINEHRSRLKSAFEREFDSALANRYYITGKKGEIMNITLPRELVDWEYKF